MRIESSAFKHQKPIPKKYTCEGEDVSPPLTFSDIPKNTKSLVLIVDDPDAPRGTFDHWILWGLPGNLTTLAEGAPIKKPVLQGKNHFQEVRYRGPCPPPGSPHRYFFKLFALDTVLSLAEGSSKSQILDAMEGHILGKAELIGTYQRTS